MSFNDLKKFSNDISECSDDEFHNVERSKPTQITLIHSCLALNQICLIQIN